MNIIRYALIALYLFNAVCMADNSIEVYGKNALFNVQHKTLPIVSTQFVGWDKGWKWAGTRVQAAAGKDGLAFSGHNKNLDLSIKGYSSGQANSHTWHYQITAAKPHIDAIGFGMSFKLNLQSASFKGLSKEPELLANNSGWRWKVSPNKTLEVRFSPPLAGVYFERGRKNEIRALFLKGIKAGRYDIDMKLSVKGLSTLAVHTGKPIQKNTTSDWVKNSIPWNTSPVDLSYLNNAHKPAGKHGALKAVGDSLAFEDGTPAKFWGANIQAYALFKTSDFNIKKQAKRLARLGFNLIRIHHHDSAWVKPNVFATSKNNTLILNSSSLKKLDWWIKCLEDEGIYVWLDLQVGRAYTKNDGISHFNEVAKGKKGHDLRGFNYYNPSIKRRIKEFNLAYLNHVNPFTGFAYKNDPAIVTTLLLNENDLTHHFGNALLADKKVPAHHRIYSSDVKAASKRLHLNPRKAGRSWEYGDSKVYLNDAEHRYNQDMIGHLKKTGLTGTVVTGNTWGGMSLAGLPSLTDGDIIDVHSYGREGELLFNPRYRAGMLQWVGAAQVTNKPLSVTEWNVEKFPVSDRFTIPTWLASIASLQGWDSLMLYGYSQRPLNGAGKGSNYSTYNDPALMAMMPASALLYRQGHVKPANHTYHIRLRENDFFGKPINPVTSASIRTLVEQSKLSVDLPYSSALPWLKPYEKAMNNSYSASSKKHHLVSNPNIDFIPKGQNFVKSDTREVMRDWQKGIQTINTDRSQIVSGNMGENIINLADVSFDIDTPKATVAVQSLDEQPISSATRILISLAARSIPSGNKRAPFLSEPVTGKIFIKAKSGMKLYEISLNSHKPLETIYSKQHGYEVKLTSDIQSPWLILE